MGLTIDRDQFRPVDYQRFDERLQHCLHALGALLERPGWGTGPATVGAELELVLVGPDGAPRSCNQAVAADADDPRVTLELVRWNLECNLSPQPLAGRPYSAWEAEIGALLGRLEAVTAARGAHVMAVGILPTLDTPALNASALTDAARYRALNDGLRRLRGREPFRIRITGDDVLEMTCDDISFQGANTAWQIHLRVDPAEFRRSYNAAQLATLPVLAVAGNSPLLVAHRLWDETRIALFKQSVDARVPAYRERRHARVAFGLDWVRSGALELFEQAVALHEPVLPIVSDEDPRAVVASGGVPGLAELRLHQSTTWSWNRAVYDSADGGHLRIEMRSLPAGPTTIDMLANAAFVTGLTLELREVADELVALLPFEWVHRGFYRAAQSGLDAELVWVDPLDGGRPETVRAADLARRLLPAARRGLARGGVAADEADRLLAVISERLATGQTGARWQRRALAALETRLGRAEAITQMTRHYLRWSASGEPVHRWPVPGRSTSHPAPRTARPAGARPRRPAGALGDAPNPALCVPVGAGAAGR